MAVALNSAAAAAYKEQKLAQLAERDAKRAEEKKTARSAAAKAAAETRKARATALLVQMSEDLQHALHATSQDVAADLCEGRDDPTIVAECCMDIQPPDRWTKATTEELRQLIAQYGYSAVLIAASKHVATW